MLLLPLFIFSKKNYFWFAFYFIISSAPGHIFAGSEGAVNSVFHLPIYNIIIGKLTTVDLFVITAFFKSVYFSFKTQKIILSKEILYFIIICIIISISTSFIYGYDKVDFFRGLRGAVFLSLIFSFVTLIKDIAEIKRFTYLLIPFLFLILADQLSLIFFKDLLINLFHPGIANLLSPVGSTRAVSTSFYLVLLCMLFGVFYYNDKKEKAFLLLVIISPVIIIISSVRMWTISLFVFAALYLFLRKIKLRKLLTIFLPIFLIFILLNLFSEFRNYFNETLYIRFSSFAASLVNGDLNNFDSLIPRIADTKRILTAISSAPVFGVGFSHIYFINKSSDLGILNIILFIGISGAIGMTVLLVRSMKNLYQIIKNSSEKKRAITLFSFYASILIPFFTTINFFAFDVPPMIFFTSILISVTQIFLIENKKINLTL